MLEFWYVRGNFTPPVASSAAALHIHRRRCTSCSVLISLSCLFLFLLFTYNRLSLRASVRTSSTTLVHFAWGIQSPRRLELVLLGIRFIRLSNPLRIDLRQLRPWRPHKSSTDNIASSVHVPHRLQCSFTQRLIYCLKHHRYTNRSERKSQFY